MFFSVVVAVVFRRDNILFFTFKKLCVLQFKDKIKLVKCGNI